MVTNVSQADNEVDEIGDIENSVPGFPNVDIDRIERDLNTEFDSLKSGYDTAKTKRMEYWKQYRFQKYGNEQPNASQVVDSTIFNAIEWMLPVLVQPFIETDEFVKIKPISADVKNIVAAEVFRELLSVQIRERMPWYQVLHDTWKGALVQGESYAKVTWVKKDEENGEPVGRPEVIAIPAYRIRYDWTVQSFSDSKVVTEEEDYSRSDIISMMKKAKNVMKDRLDKCLETPGRDFKTGRLRDEEQNQPNWVGEDNTKSSLSQTLYLRREHYTYYDMKGDGVAIPIMAVFIDDKLVQVIKNPYPFNKHPYVAAQDTRDPLGNPAFGHAEILKDVQAFRTGILRMISDNLNAQHNGLYEMDMNNVDDIARILLENAPPGSKTALPVRKPGSITAIESAPIAQQAFQAWDIQAEVGENRSGYTRYSQGLDSKSLNQTATGITQIMQRSDMRMWELAQRFAEMVIKPMVRMMIALNQDKLDDQSLRLQFGLSSIPAGANNSEFKGLNPGEWLTLKKEDLGGFFSVTVDIDVASDKQQRIDNMINLLQFLGGFVDQGVPRDVISIIAVELAKAMGLPKVQTAMRAQYVGTSGVTIPTNAFTGSTEGPLGADTGLGSAVGSPSAGSGVQEADLGSILGGLAQGGEEVNGPA